MVFGWIEDNFVFSLILIKDSGLIIMDANHVSGLNSEIQLEDKGFPEGSDYISSCVYIFHYPIPNNDLFAISPEGQ